MNDKELLEPAARAAKLEIIAWETCCGVEVAILSDLSRWQPLNENAATDCMGDALRLAVKLGLQIKRHYYKGDYYIDVPWGTMASTKTEPCHPDPYAAARRAIVRAAAEIGRSIK